MTYKNYKIKARQFENDFGNWFAMCFPINKDRRIEFVNYSGNRFVQTRKEIYALEMDLLRAVCWIAFISIICCLLMKCAMYLEYKRSYPKFEADNEKENDDVQTYI
jgi:hypothetical protein